MLVEWYIFMFMGFETGCTTPKSDKMDGFTIQDDTSTRHASANSGIQNVATIFEAEYAMNLQL